MRKIPDVTPPEDLTPQTLPVIEQKRTYELITPLYGGGVEVNQADPVTIVRATEIRGQLRFWWRALRGGQTADDDAMKTRENAIWGKAYEKGDPTVSADQTIQIVVDVIREGTLIKPFEMRGQRPVAINDIPGYVAFPLQPDQNMRKAAKPEIPSLRQGVQFTLTITYPRDRHEEIEAALWAWETFGGLGARTRRGFGALHLVAPNEFLPTAREVERWIQTQASKHSRGGTFPDGTPHLGSPLSLVVTPPSASPMQAWNRLIRKLQSFRQQKDARKRSAWPEADTIREAVGKGPAARTRKFPRAAFGLPVVFHFTGNNAPAGNYTLNEIATEQKDSDTDEDKGPHNKGRFASPLLLRPFLCADRQAVGLALLLEGSRVNLQQLVLKDDQKKPLTVGNGTMALSGALTLAEARAIAQKSSDSQSGADALWTLQEETDILQAFLKSLKGV